jgi:hypothetical protein
MNQRRRIIVAIAAALEAAAAIVVYNMMSDTPAVLRMLIVGAIIVFALIFDGLLLRGRSAASISDVKKLKDTDDYITALYAWLDEDTPFGEHIQIAIKQLESLKRKQNALRAVLDDSKESPFLSVANDVNTYVLANCRRILNRVMIYDQGEPHKYNMHVTYLQEILGENAHVLSDFENLILEVSQIGDDALADTPCLNELTAALRSVRKNTDEQWDQLTAQTMQSERSQQ